MIDGIINEPTVNFVGKDGFFWWVGEVEDNEDPMELGRVRVRVLGYYTNVRGGTTADLRTEDLPWATVLQHTSQPGNDGQGESSGQLQPGAIVMGFFMDGENAQMPIVIGVLRVNKSPESNDKNIFAFTGENMEPGSQGHVNPVLYSPADPTYNVVNEKGNQGNKQRSSVNASVPIPGNKTTAPVAGKGAPGTSLGSKLPGSGANTQKPVQPSKPIPAANGVGGPWKTLEYKLSYLIEDIASHAGTLVKAEDGDFLDIVEGKLVSAKALTAKLQNFLSAVYSQIIAAIRQQISSLAENLELVSILGSIGGGVPFAVTTAIQSALTTLLSSLCQVDNQLISMIQDPVGAVTGLVESFLDGLIDRATLVLSSVQEVIDRVVCNVQNILSSLLSVVDTVKSVVQGYEQATAVIETWQAGSDLFADGADMLTKGITSISGLIALVIKFVQGDCGRNPDDGKDTVGWYPLYGVTHCTEEELAEIQEIMGFNKSRASCGDAFGVGSLIDSIYNDADPYLTAAKTWLDGAYELHVGTPGRQATVKKSANGTTHFSTNLNNSEYADYNARRVIKQKYPDADPEEVESKVASYKKSQNSGKGNTGTLVADDISWSGNLTQTVNGDDCKVVKNDYTRTIDGDYRLKVTGNCHIEVGGGFFFAAEGAPRMVDKNGNTNSGQQKIQKHTVRFGSDVDINVTGAKMHLEMAEFDLAANKHIVTGATMDNSVSKQTYAGGELNLTGDSSITLSTIHYTRLINQGNPLSVPAKSGITTLCNGSIITTQAPSITDPVPIYSIVNPVGNKVEDYGTGYVMNIKAGGYVCNVTAGGLVQDVDAGAVSINAKAGAVTITAGLTCTVKAETIFLN